MSKGSAAARNTSTRKKTAGANSLRLLGVNGMENALDAGDGRAATLQAATCVVPRNASWFGSLT